MNALRSLGNIVLWVVAAIGIAAGGLWVANTAGYVQPLVVVSGSMEPGIMTGDLLFSTPTDAASLTTGDVITTPSMLTGKLVTHRIIDIAPTALQGEYLVHMKGDNNEFTDGEEYIVSGPVWTPSAQITGGGYVLANLTRPGVVLPLAITIFALIALSMLPKPEEDEDELADVGPNPSFSTTPSGSVLVSAGAFEAQR